MARLKAKIDGRWITGENAQQLVERAVNNRPQDANIPTVNEYVNQYMDLYKDNDAIEENTAIGYWGYLRNHILPSMGEMLVTEITRDTVQSYINDKAKTLAKKTIKEHLTLMGEVFDALLEDGIIKYNPFKSRRLKLKGKASAKVKAYTEDEFTQFEQNVLPKLKGSTLLYAAITFYTGMRKGEICALQWEDVNFESRRLTVTKTIIWPSQNKGQVKPRPKTENGDRDPVIMPQLLFILKGQAKESGYLIRGERSKEDEPITNQGMKRLYGRIKAAVEESGIDFDISCLNRRGRHTMATLMNNAGVDDKTIEDQLGHYDADFTRQRYMNPQRKQVERGMEKLSVYIEQMAQR